MSDYTDIQPELDDFENAVYGEEVRDSMVSAIKKIYDIAESAADSPDATTATAGQVLTADGQGGWQWGDVATSGDSVPTEVRQAILALFQNGVYTRDDMSDEVAVIQSWATEVTAISVSPTTLSINGMETQTIVATTQPAGGIVSWSSSDESIATVSGGVVTPTGVNGSCTITASCGGKSATCAVTVSGFATLLSISAVYTQSGTVYDTDSLDDLKSDLVVTASYNDSTTETLTSSQYTLSGTLTEGTSVITVTYGGKSDTFSVTVSANWESLIDSDISGWYYYQNASYSGDTITIAPANVSWNNYVKPVTLFQYSAIKNKRVRVSGTCELTGYSSGNGFAVTLGTFTAPSGVSARKSYVNLATTVADTTGWLTESGTFTFDTKSFTLSDVLTEGTTPSDSEWVNVIIYLNANSGCIATIKDVTVEYVNE